MSNRSFLSAPESPVHVVPTLHCGHRVWCMIHAHVSWHHSHTCCKNCEIKTLFNLLNPCSDNVDSHHLPCPPCLHVCIFRCTVKPVLRDHCRERPPVLKDHISCRKVLHFNVIEPVTWGELPRSHPNIWHDVGSPYIICGVQSSPAPWVY